MLAYNAIYRLFDTPSAFLTDPYDSLLPPLFDGTHTGGEIDALMPEIPRDILNPDLVAAFDSDPNHPFRVRLRENDVYDWAPRAPIRLYHCGQVAFFDPLPTGDHGACAAPSLLLAKLWFDGF